MSEHELDPYVEWIAREAKRAVAVDAMAVERVMSVVRAQPRPVRRGAGWRWFLEARPLALSPLTTAAMAAGLVGIGALFGLTRSSAIDRGGQPTGPLAVAGTPQPPTIPAHVDTVQVIKFVLVAPHAKTVSVVGDFNDWDAKATPMTRTPTGGTWSVALPLHSGRHVYAFVVNGVDGVQWLADPSAPLAPEDGLGAPNSVVLVGGSTS